MPVFGFSLDLRSPDFGTPHGRLYSEMLDMVEWGEKHGIGFTQLMEHHASPDGYLPSPFVFAAGVAARTKKMKIQIGAVLLPLHDPVNVAEDFAVADLVSGGRMIIVLGAGYNRPEFAMFRRRLEDRAKALDEGTEIILRALSGERFEYDGREIFVRPRPVQDPYDCILTGGGVPASVHRAMKFGLGMYPMNEATAQQFEQACAEAGRATRFVYRTMGWIHVSEDPEKTLRQVMPHIDHVVRSYAEFAKDTTSSSPFVQIRTGEDFQKVGGYKIVTPDEAVKLCEEAEKGKATVTFSPMFGGLSPDIGWEMLELFANKVLPRVNAQEAWGPLASSPS